MLIATRGLPASGKTTWAKTMVDSLEPGTAVRVNRDDLRRMLHGEAHHEKRTEEQVTAVQHRSIAALIRSGTTVIVDDTNLRARNLRSLAELAWKADVVFRVEDFTDVGLDECLRRNRLRDERLPEDVIRGMHTRFLKGRKLPLPVPEKPDNAVGRPYVPNPTLPQAVMVDIDGTVALHGDRSPYDPTRYHEDLPNQPVIDTVRALSERYQLVFCSGRDETYRDVTERWIWDNVRISPDHLHMRSAGDTRRDDVVKLELFDKHIRDEWHVVGVFDDRDRVVAAWRGIGLTVMQVAPGDF